MALLGALAFVPAHAEFHFMKIVEVFPGTAASPDAHYIVIQMYTSGQNFVAGHDISVFDAAGGLVATFTFPNHVSNGASQAKILIATSQAQSFFSVPADLIMTPALVEGGGKVCFAGTIDCVAWGGWSGSSSGVGTPFNASGGLESGRAAIRRLDIAGSSTFLDAGDDTNDCANDFVSGLPAPRNNAGVGGTIPPSTCGNNSVEGLEQCDDGNLSDNDGCSSTCVNDTPVSVVAPDSDFNGDGKSDVFWRNMGTGSNAVWLSGNSATPQSASGVGDLNWHVVGQGDFNGDGKSDVFWRHAADGRNVIWLSGNAGAPQATTRVTNQDWKVVGVGDFNGDGKSDVFWRNVGTGANAIWLSGNSATLQATTNVTNLDWQVVRAGDFNGDGRSDVFWRNVATGRNAIWLSASSATTQVTSAVTNLDWEVVPYEGQALEAIPANPTPSLPAMSIADVSKNEGDTGTSQAIFMVRLSKASTSDVTYDIATADATAQAGFDYSASSLGGETIPAGQTSRQFVVTIYGDTLVEEDEYFTVTASNVTGADLDKAMAIGTIIEDDYAY